MNNLGDMRICYGSCQMIGTASVFLSIKDAVVIFNSPRWCALTAERELTMARLRYEERLYCTEVQQDTLVYGVEASLKDTLAEVYAERKPSFLAVVTSCSMSLIGDDVKVICQRYSKTAEVAAIDAGGLSGGFASGYVKAQLELLHHADFILQKKPACVNILGASAAYPHWRGDIAEIKRLLNLCGIEVNIVFGVDQLGINELNKLGCASLNVVVDSDLGLKTAQWLKDNRDMDYLVASWPYGLQATLEWLEIISAACKRQVDLCSIKDEAAMIEKAISEQIAWIEHNFDDCYISQLVFSMPKERALSIRQAVQDSKIDLLHCQDIFIKDTEATFDSENERRWSDVSELPDIADDKLRLLLASDRERFLLGKYAQTLYLDFDMPVARLHNSWSAFVGLRGWQNFITCVCEQLITLKCIQSGI